MPQYEYSEIFPVFHGEAEFKNWIAGMKLPADVRQFTYPAEGTGKARKLWVVITTWGSGVWRRSVFIAREGVGGDERQIGVTASVQAIMYAKLQIDFDPKRHRVKVYGKPHFGEFGYPQATLLVEYCFGLDG